MHHITSTLTEPHTFQKKQGVRKKVNNPQTSSQIIDYSICHTTPNIFLDCRGELTGSDFSKTLCSELLLYNTLSE